MNSIDKIDHIADTFVPHTDEEKQAIRDYMAQPSSWLRASVDPDGQAQTSMQSSIWNNGNTDVTVRIDTNVTAINPKPGLGSGKSFYGKVGSAPMITWWSDTKVEYRINDLVVELNQIIIDDCLINLNPRNDKTGKSSGYGEQYVEIGIPVNAYKNILIRANADGISADVLKFIFTKEDNCVWINVAIRNPSKDDAGRPVPLMPLFSGSEGDEEIDGITSLKHVIQSDNAGYYKSKLTLSMYTSIALPIGTTPIDITDIVYTMKFKLVKAVLHDSIAEVVGSFNRAPREVY